MVMFVIINESLLTELKAKVHLFRYFLFLDFYIMNSFNSRILPSTHITLSYHIYVGCSWLRPFLRLSIFLMTLTIFRNTNKVFCRLLLCWDLSEALLIIRFGLWFLGRKTTEVKGKFHHILNVDTLHTTSHLWTLLVWVLLTWSREF